MSVTGCTGYPFIAIKMTGFVVVVHLYPKITVGRRVNPKMAAPCRLEHACPTGGGTTSFFMCIPKLV